MRTRMTGTHIALFAIAASTLFALGCEKQSSTRTTTSPQLATETSAIEKTADDASGKPTVDVADVAKSDAVYLASFERDQISINLHDVSEEESAELAKWLTEKIEKKGDLDALIPVDDPIIPKRFQKTKAYDVILPENARVTAKVKGFFYSSGASEDHLLAILTLPEGEENHAYGIARPAGKLSPKATLRPATPHEIDAKQQAALLKTLHDAIEEKLLDEDRSKLPAKINAEQVQLTRGKLPGKSSFIAAVDLRVGDDITQERISCIVMLNDALEVTSFIEPPNFNITHYEVSLYLDLEGDGRERVLYDSSYYEGSYKLMLSFGEDGKPQVVILDGDGA